MNSESPKAAATGIDISVVIPIFNEAQGLQELFDRLYPVLDGLGRSFEVIFVNDGSTDTSGPILAGQFEKRPDHTRVLELNSNHGQYMAVIAGLEHVRGEVVVTLDGDLQNPPEEIPNLLEKIAAGHDSVGTYRVNRHDNAFRRWASRGMNFLRAQTTGIHMRDQGCMLRAYSRSVSDAVVQGGVTNVFIPALAYTASRNPTEIPVRHEARQFGKSKYSLERLVRLNFDLFTAFTLAPLQYFTLVAMACTGGSFVLLAALVTRQFFWQPADDVFYALLGVLCVLISLTMLGIGLVGEYVGRSYLILRNRRRYTLSRILQKPAAAADAVDSGAHKMEGEAPPEPPAYASS